jgi:hypothetical protein
MKLVLPTIEHREKALAYKQEHFDNGGVLENEVLQDNNKLLQNTGLYLETRMLILVLKYDIQ